MKTIFAVLTIAALFAGCSGEGINKQDIGYTDEVIYSIDADRVIDAVHYIDGHVDDEKYLQFAIEDINISYNSGCNIYAIENLRFYLTCVDI